MGQGWYTQWYVWAGVIAAMAFLAGCVKVWTKRNTTRRRPVAIPIPQMNISAIYPPYPNQQAEMPPAYPTQGDQTYRAPQHQMYPLPVNITPPETTDNSDGVYQVGKLPSYDEVCEEKNEKYMETIGV